MPTFSYTARNIDGRAVSGSLSAADERAVREQLRRNNLFVTRLQVQAANRPGTSAPSFFRQRVKLYDLVVFSRQFATLVRAGLPLTEALGALAEQTRSDVLRSAISEMQRDIGTGSSLTVAMRKHSGIFPELYVSLTEAGELGGMLDQTLDSAATQLDMEMEIREKIKSAFVYPIAVVVVAVGVVVFLLTYVVPVFANIYKQFRAQLPPVTQILVTLSDVLRSYWAGAFLAAILLTYVAAKRYNATPAGRRFFDNFKQRLPLFGPLVQKMALSRFAHTLSALTDSGVPLISALATCGRVSGSSLIVEAMTEVSTRVQQGNRLGMAMAETKRFPLLMTRMITAGEESGDLGEMLRQVARFLDREVDYGVKRLMVLIEPVLTVGLGIVVGFILLALYYPVFNLGKVMR